MTKDEFLLRFSLQSLAPSDHNYFHGKPLKSAAVLIGLVETKNSGLQVLLTKRASHLRHHPSQISFPGGRSELEDSTLIITALRETKEEIGLAAQAINVIGQLPPYETISGYHVTPIVALIDKEQDYQCDPNEVSEIFQVPLQYFLNEGKHQVIIASKNGKQHNVHFMPYKHYNIWGATAAMLKDLVNHIN